MSNGLEASKGASPGMRKWIAVAFGALALGIVIGYSLSLIQHRESERTDSKGIPISFANLALHALGEEDRERASLLMASSLNALTGEPHLATDVWQRIYSHLDSDTEEHISIEDKLVTVERFQQHLDTGLRQANNEENFLLLWEARKDAADFYTELQERLNQMLLAKASEIAEAIQNAENFDATFEAFIDQTNEPLDGSSISLRAEAPDAVLYGDITGAEAEPLREMVRVLLAQAEDRLASFEEQRDAQIERGRQNEDIQPANDGEPGPCEQLVQETASLANKLEEAEVMNWAWSLEDEEIYSRLSNIETEIDGMIPQLRLLQRLRYNLWAMRQIYAAEDVPGWAGRLGVIDVSQLHPTVSTLYSMAFDRRLSEQSGRSERHRVVRTLLHEDKPDISRF